MLVKNRMFWLVVAVALLGATWYRGRVYQEPPKPETPNLVFVTGGSGPFWQIAINGAKAAARDLKAELKVEMPADESLEEQFEILTRVRMLNPDGLAISPLDAERQTNVINQFAAETNVVTFDSDAPLSERQCYVGTSNYSAGELCANLVHQAVPNGGEVAVLLANRTKDNLIDRQQGFQDAINELHQSTEEADAPGPTYDVVGYFVDDGDSDKSAQVIREVLTQHPNLACFVGMNAQHGPILLRVLKQEGKLGQVKLVTFDEEEATLNGVASGDIFATIAQDPYRYGYEAVRMLTSLHGSGPSPIPIVGNGSILVEAEAINKDNLAKFRQRLKSRMKPETEAAKDPV